MKLMFLVALSLLSTAFSYKILCLFPVPSRSHYQLGQGIVEALLKAGHEITLVTPYPVTNPVKNLKQIDVSVVRALVDNVNMMVKADDDNFGMNYPKNITILTANCPALRQELIDTQFDAVVSEWFFSDTDAGYAAVQQVPWIVLNSKVMHHYMELLVDEIRTVSTLPSLITNFPVPMNFWQRVVNAVIVGKMVASFTMDSASARYEEFFAPIAAARGVPLPPFRSALYNISILFVNSHPSIAPAQSLPPNVVDIAGYHISEETAPLPKDLQDVMDSSPQGIVYFSMGSVANATLLPKKTKQDLAQVLGELPYTVLWKFEEELQGLSKNIHIRSWWPQPSILAHPHTKLFITHGGQLSTLEAVHYGVPVLAIPLFGDQPSNAERAVSDGFARKVTFSPDMGEELRQELKEILNNDSYYKRAKHLSKLFNNRPVTPHKLIPHYVELAIETKGAYHLRSKTHLYPWYQRWMLDQLLAVLVLLHVLCAALKKLFRLCKKSEQVKVPTKKVKKN